MSDIDDLINMIEGKMNDGVSRLKVNFSDDLHKKEKHTITAGVTWEARGLPGLSETVMQSTPKRKKHENTYFGHNPCA